MRKILISIISLFLFLSLSLPVNALSYDLLAPSGQLERGQDVKFTINIDTEGKSYTTNQIGMTYDQTLVEYVSTSPGNTFTSVTTNPQSDGKLLITANSSSGFSGSGVFAYVTFKIIASSPGSTEICALYNPQNTPTPAPQPTSQPAPTALPQTGNSVNTVYGLIGGIALLSFAGLGLIVMKKL